MTVVLAGFSLEVFFKNFEIFLFILNVLVLKIIFLKIK